VDGDLLMRIHSDGR